MSERKDPLRQGMHVLAENNTPKVKKIMSIGFIMV